MAGQIGHRDLCRRHGRTCGVSAPQRAPTARKCTVRTTARTTGLAHPLLDRPFGRAEGAIRRRQDDLLGAVQR